MMHKFKFFEGFIENTYVFDEINVVTRRVQRGERRMRAQWTRELIEDLNTLHTIDAEAEITALLSEQIAQEIDDDIVDTITRRINGGDNRGMDYFNHWLRIGNDRA